MFTLWCIFCISPSMNENPDCPRCKASAVIKSGKIQGKQRYKCKECGMQFTRLTPRGRPATEKATAIMLYALGLSMNAIAQFLQVSTPAILYWIRDFTQKNCEKPEPSSAIVVELDEMWHFLNLKKTNSGYGKLIAEIQENLLTGNVENVTGKPSRN